MDELYTQSADDTRHNKIKPQDLVVEPANQNQDIYYEIANLYKQYPKHVVHKHLNNKFSDNERRKTKIQQRLQNKLNQKIIKFD
jgi:hypothetical protein